MLSSRYTDWMGQLLTGPIPPETKATCDNCAMLPQPSAPAKGIFFHPVTRCCTFEPTLVNYRAGLILSDDDPDLAAGRRTVEDRLAARVAVTPWGMDVSARFLLLYKNALGSFGQAPALGCPHQIDGNCGIWRHRPATCATWFCKHSRGATGFDFWADLGELLREVDKQLGLWCALEMGADPAPLARLLEQPKPLDASDLGGAFPKDVYRTLWGRWAGKEAEFYRGCAELARPLDWEQVVQICGPRVTALSRLVHERHEKLTSQAPPDHPRAGIFQIQGLEAGRYTATTYSPYDPFRISPDLLAVLPHFDGRPSDEALEEIRVQRGIRLDPALMRRMADFRILVESSES